MRALLLVLVLLLAGCASENEPSSGATGTTRPETPTTPGGTGTTPPLANTTGPVAMLLDYDFEGCHGYDSTWPVPTESARPHVPEAFEIREVTSPFGSALVRYTWLECDQFVAANGGIVNDTVFGFVAVSILDGGAEADVDQHWYLLRMITTDDIMQQLWTTAGYDVAAGDFAGTFTGVQEAPLGAGAYQPSIAGYSADLVGASYLGAEQNNVALYTETRDGLLIWTASREASHQILAEGRMVVDSGDPFADEPFDNRMAGQVSRIVETSSWLDNNLWRHSLT